MDQDYDVSTPQDLNYPESHAKNRTPRALVLFGQFADPSQVSEAFCQITVAILFRFSATAVFADWLDSVMLAGDPVLVISPFPPQTLGGAKQTPASVYP
ncbi:hypothetical protein FSARC_162 [Fusarium sarcochroum]|uniref:Uncharacterized protein n=1 Tax=Fusarium sarcochroum TaxID=1208366 RepID=A0A8H4UBX0_9HYPO|nr:hypothetical protein FSARC_162 [Fusarium sarcochroum]